MKIGINLSGVSYETHYRNRNFEPALDAFNEYIVKPLQDDGHSIGFYIYTYDTIKTGEVKKAYQPLCKFQFIDEASQVLLPNYTAEKQNLINGLMDMRGEDLDVVIKARFDQKFNYNPLKYYNWDFNKVMFFWREPVRHDLPLLNHSFFTFPYHMLDNVIDAIAEINDCFQYSLHNIYQPLVKRVGSENVKWADGEFRTRQMNNLYTLTRIDHDV
jgi:hypothetical protein